MWCDCNLTAFIFPSQSIDRNQKTAKGMIDRGVWWAFFSVTMQFCSPRGETAPGRRRGERSMQTSLKKQSGWTYLLANAPFYAASKWNALIMVNTPLTPGVVAAFAEIYLIETETDWCLHPAVQTAPAQSFASWKPELGSIHSPTLTTPQRHASLVFCLGMCVCLCVCTVNLIRANREKWINNGKANTVADRGKRGRTERDRQRLMERRGCRWGETVRLQG